YACTDGQLIYHMDWYRLKDEEEAIQAGVEDYLQGKYLCLIEWPERAAGLLPEECLHITITAEDEQTRRIDF
ncbi:MAG TPA: tRNA (adenosine(37)-N6)-threonylcarbamoyltransferase complex ATPase subunit type 1 TsaE, partial [Segetibacter sp.]